MHRVDAQGPEVAAHLTSEFCPDDWSESIANANEYTGYMGNVMYVIYQDLISDMPIYATMIRCPRVFVGSNGFFSSKVIQSPRPVMEAWVRI